MRAFELEGENARSDGRFRFVKRSKISSVLFVVCGCLEEDDMLGKSREQGAEGRGAGSIGAQCRDREASPMSDLESADLSGQHNRNLPPCNAPGPLFNTAFKSSLVATPVAWGYVAWSLLTAQPSEAYLAKNASAASDPAKATADATLPVLSEREKFLAAADSAGYQVLDFDRDIREGKARPFPGEPVNYFYNEFVLRKWVEPVLLWADRHNSSMTSVVEGLVEGRGVADLEQTVSTRQEILTVAVEAYSKNGSSALPSDGARIFGAGLMEVAGRLSKAREALEGYRSVAEGNVALPDSAATGSDADSTLVQKQKQLADRRQAAELALLEATERWQQLRDDIATFYGDLSAISGAQQLQRVLEGDNSHGQRSIAYINGDGVPVEKRERFVAIMVGENCKLTYIAPNSVVTAFCGSPDNLTAKPR